MVSRKDEQLGILAKRFKSAGVARRDFLKIAAAAAAGTVTAAGMEKYVGPGASAASRHRFYAMQDSEAQVLYQFGRQDDPTSFDFNLNLYCNAEPAVYSGLLTFDPDLNAIPDWAAEFTANDDASVWTFKLRPDNIGWTNGTDTRPVTGSPIRIRGMSSPAGRATSRPRRTRCPCR